MLSLSRPMGRIPFFLAVSLTNMIIALAVMIVMGFQPSGSGHLAVLLGIGGLQAFWFVLHARRFADAGKSPFAPFLVFLACFASFALGYLLLAALWSSPEVQQEAFRTGGGIANRGWDKLETSPLIIDTGRAIAAWLGAAGALILSGFIAIMLTIVAVISGVFSIFALLLPGGRARIPVLTNAGTSWLQRPQG